MEERWPLHRAAESGDTNAVRQTLSLQRHGIDDRDEDGLTALHLAVREGFSEVVELLLACEANPNVPSSSGYTPMYLIIFAPLPMQVAIASILATAGARMNHRLSLETPTLLVYLIRVGFSELRAWVAHNYDFGAVGD